MVEGWGHGTMGALALGGEGGSSGEPKKLECGEGGASGHALQPLKLSFGSLVPGWTP